MCWHWGILPTAGRSKWHCATVNMNALYLSRFVARSIYNICILKNPKTLKPETGKHGSAVLAQLEGKQLSVSDPWVYLLLSSSWWYCEGSSVSPFFHPSSELHASPQRLTQQSVSWWWPQFLMTFSDDQWGLAYRAGCSCEAVFSVFQLFGLPAASSMHLNAHHFCSERLPLFVNFLAFILYLSLQGSGAYWGLPNPASFLLQVPESKSFSVESCFVMLYT